MPLLTQELEHVQNPALGGVLLWRFACGYTDHHKSSDHPHLQLAFIVLPLLFHRESLELLQRTNRRTGLHGFGDKFSRHEHLQSDVLLSIQSRALAWRALTWESLQLGVSARLVTIGRADGTLIPLTTTSPRGVPPSVKLRLNNAEKLGEWCSELSLFEVGTILKVEF